MDIDETPDAFHIRAELPGVQKEDINVAVDNNLLTIKGEKKKRAKGPQAPKNRMPLRLICPKFYIATARQSGWDPCQIP